MITDVVVKEEAEIFQFVIDKGEESEVINIAVFGLDKKNQQAKITSLQREKLIYIPSETQDFDAIESIIDTIGGGRLI